MADSLRANFVRAGLGVGGRGLFTFRIGGWVGSDGGGAMLWNGSSKPIPMGS